MYSPYLALLSVTIFAPTFSRPVAPSYKLDVTNSMTCYYSTLTEPGGSLSRLQSGAGHGAAYLCLGRFTEIWLYHRVIGPPD
jgi:hypothetical protein